MDEDKKIYDYYKGMYESFSGNPTMQAKIKMAYFDEINPAKLRAKKEQQMLLSSFLGGGQTNPIPQAQLSDRDIADYVLQRDYAQPTVTQNVVSTQAVTPQISSTTTGTNQYNTYEDLANALINKTIDETTFNQIKNSQQDPNGFMSKLQAVTQQKFSDQLRSENPIGYAVRDLIGGVVNSVTAAPRKVVNAVSNRLQSGINYLTGGETDVTKQTPILMSDQEMADYYKDPLLGLVKGVAETGSWLLPVGKAATIGGAMLKAVPAAALQGFGSSKNGEEVLGTLLGAGTGAVMGGATKLVGNILGGSARQTGQNLVESTYGIKAPKTVTGALDQKYLKNEVTRIFAEQGVKKEVPAMAGSMAYEALGEQFAKAAAKIAEPVDTGLVQGNFVTELSKYGMRNVPNTDETQFVDLLLNKLDRNPTMVEATNAVRELDGVLGPAYKKIQKGASLEPAEKVQMSARNAIRNMIDQTSPELSSIYKDMSVLHTAMPDVINSFNKAGTVFVAGAKIPTLGLPGKAIRGVGELLEKAPVIPGVANQQTQALTTRGLTGSLINGLANTSNQSTTELPQGVNQNTNQDISVGINNLLSGDNSNAIGNINAGTANVGATPSINKEGLKQYLLMGLLNGTIDSSTATAIGNLIAEPKLTAEELATQKQQKTDTQSLQSLQFLDNEISKNQDQFLSKSNPLALNARVKDLGGIAADPQREYVKTLIGQQLASLIKDLSGTAASDAERAFLSQQLPSLYDTFDTAKAKLKALQNRVKNRINGIPFIEGKY